jgi:hypothetical protein
MSALSILRGALPFVCWTIRGFQLAEHGMGIDAIKMHASKRRKSLSIIWLLDDEN